MFSVEAIGEVTAFESTAEARSVVTEICDAVGLPANFRIYAVRDPRINAYAKIVGTDRLVVYDEEFMRRIADRSSRDWSGLAVMSHEVGHHLCGHTLDGLGSRPPKELEADHFAGFVIARIGGNLQNATRVFEGMSEAGSATHPPRRERIAAVTAGWRKGLGQQQATEERHNVITHNEQNGRYVRVIVEFAGRNRDWTEYQRGQPFAAFREHARDSESVFLFDASRSIWIRLDRGKGAAFATGYWARGVVAQLPSSWIPLDPVNWR